MPEETTGWQPDGSYVSCDECGYAPPPDDLPDFAVAVHIPGTLHRSDCPTIPRLTPEDAEALQRDLDAFDRMRRRAYVEARNVWIA